ncbi:hypothetical protein [Flammeovirga sp. SJP92]|uniref:hypothetical protein n=1 Tax=Flammeovirga sp. SJP92 TaxID=1775430 RepID=UPI000787F4A2|nr:hypothetical protein [Flammeovirga sp. SJP92]KXX69269.1 hypothetical protein AVL50_20120 [Flammeovirga sp. SJP92]
MGQHKDYNNDFDYEEEHQHSQPHTPITPEQRTKVLEEYDKKNHKKNELVKRLLKLSAQQSTVYLTELRKIVNEERGFFNDLASRATQIMRLFTKADEQGFINDERLVKLVLRDLDIKDIIIAIQDWKSISYIDKINLALRVDDEIPYWLFLKLIKNNPNYEAVKRRCNKFDHDDDLDVALINSLIREAPIEVANDNKKSERFNTDLPISKLIKFREEYDTMVNNGASKKKLKNHQKKFITALKESGFDSETDFDKYVNSLSEDYYKNSFLPEAIELTHSWLDTSEESILKEYKNVVDDNGKLIFESLQKYSTDFKTLEQYSKSKYWKFLEFFTDLNYGQFLLSLTSFSPIMVGLPGAVNLITSIDPSFLVELGEINEAHAKVLNRVKTGLASEHPIFLDSSLDIISLYDDYVKNETSTNALSEHLREHLIERLENIDTVREAIIEDPEQVLSMELVINATKPKVNQLSIPHYDQYVDQKVEDKKDLKLYRDIGLAVLSIGAGVATFFTAGGASPLLAGTLGAISVSLSVADIYITHSEYNEENARANTSIDPVLKLSAHDPAFGWVLLSYAGAILDVVDAVKVLPKVSKALRSGKTITGELTELGQALKSANKIASVADFVSETLYKIHKRRAIINDVVQEVLEKGSKELKEKLPLYLERFFNELLLLSDNQLEFALADGFQNILKASTDSHLNSLSEIVQNAVVKFNAKELGEFAEVAGKQLYDPRFDEVFKSFKESSRLRRLVNKLDSLDDITKELYLKQLGKIVNHKLFQKNKVAFSNIFEKYVIGIIKDGKQGLSVDDLGNIFEQINKIESVAPKLLDNYLKNFEGTKLANIKAKYYVKAVEAVIDEPKALSEFLNQTKNDAKLLTDLFKGAKNSLEKGYRILAESNKHLVELLQKGGGPFTPNDIKELTDYLKEYKYLDSGTLGDMRYEFMNGFYEKFADIIPDTKQIGAYLETLRYGAGSVTETYVFKNNILQRIKGYEHFKSLEIKFDLSNLPGFKNKNLLIPDQLMVAYHKMGGEQGAITILAEIKAGYRSGNISDKQIKNYINFMKIIDEGEEAAEELLKQIAKKAGISNIDNILIEGIDYLFVPTIAKGDGLTDKAAEVVVKKFAKYGGGSDLLLEGKIRLNYIDEGGMVQTLSEEQIEILLNL